jgi:hypothetical protein
MSEPVRRKAANEVVFREVNERIEGLQRQFALAEQEPLQIVCECDRLDCLERVSVPLASYERLRAEAACFVVVPGHEDHSVEDVVDSSDGYFVVRKHKGEPREIAEGHDPRS